MSETKSPSFEDPGLKAAIRRTWGKETAPPALRARIAAAGAIRPRTAAPFVWRFRQPLFGLAAAAMVVVAVTLVFRPWQQRRFDSSSPPSNSLPTAFGVPASLANDLVARHDFCSGEPDHHGIPSDDFDEIRRELHEALGFPILSGSMPGWDFHGASLCLVGKTKSGHLLFARKDGQFISLFSLPPQVVDAQGDEQGRIGDYSQMAERHPLAGFHTMAGTYFVVGSSPDGSLTLDDVRSMRDRLKPDVAEGDDGPSVSLASH